MQIKKINNNTFQVTIDSHKFKVILDDNYWEKLTKKIITKEQLIEKSFKFLLQREPVTSILPKFPLQMIQKYFPQFEQEFQQ